MMRRPSSRVWRIGSTSLLLALPLIIAIYMDLARDVDPANPESKARFIRPAITWAGVALIALIKPRFGARWFQFAEQAIARLARHRRASIACVGLVAFLVSAAVSLTVRMPQPVITDEFCHLLAADTFAHGRLTNPTHPLWVHFETVGVIHQPSYASKYPPGQGLALAVGQVLTGYPIVGAWLSVALACAALCWMLMAWLPPRWALLGGLLAILHPTVLQWSQNYWGGAIAMGGGALVIGAFRRLRQQPRAWDACLLGLGLALLANSRPYEGLVLSLPLMIALFVKLVGRGAPPFKVSLKRIAWPLFGILMLTAGAMGFYNLRVTGHVWRLPYKVHQETYDVAPSFIWQPAQPEPVYRHPRLRQVHVNWELPTHTLQRSSVTGFVAEMMNKISILAGGAFPLLVLVIPLLALPLVLNRDRWMRFMLCVSAFFLLTILLNTWMWPHYAAPAVGLAFILVLQALRYVRAWRWRGQPCGRFIARASLVLFILSLAPTCLGLYNYYSFGWGGWIETREKMIAKLKSEPGQHLVVVRYGGLESIHHEWIFNEADIDHAKIVWAREMDPEQNRRLLDYFKDRRVWLLMAETATPALVPYTDKTIRFAKLPLLNRPSH